MDNFSRVEESIVKYIIMKNFAKADFLLHKYEWLNPNEVCMNKLNSRCKSLISTLF